MSDSGFPNSREALSERAARGRLTWVGPVVLSFARLLLAMMAQGLCALVLLLGGTPRPLEESARWMTVWGTLVDLGSLALMAFFLRREGLSVRALFRARAPTSWPRTVGLALLYLVVFGIIGFSVAAAASLLITGTAFSEPPVGHLPLWAGLYSTLVWPLIWGFTEQATYDGYAVPRLEVLRGRAFAVALVSLGWAAQHLALPFRPDAAYLALRFIPSLAIALTSTAIYLRTRNLLPLAIAHWLIDAGTGALTLK
jgi:membrane protease YdiL (CAAX protease family)